MSRLPAVALALAALAAAPAASGHVTVSPTRLAPASSALLVFSVPNERKDADLTGLRLELPEGLEITEVEAVPGWSASSSARTVIWRGGRIGPAEFATFSLRATAAGRQARLAIVAQELLADGPGPTYHPSVLVAPLPQTAARRDAGARDLGQAALVVAVAAALLALLAGLLALSLWLRRER